MAKVTKKDVLTKVLGWNELSEDEVAVVQGMIAGLDKRSAKPTKAQVANEGVKAKIAEVLTTEPQTAKAIADAAGIESTNKVASLLRQMEGVIVTEGKGKNPKTYSIAE